MYAIFGLILIQSHLIIIQKDYIEIDLIEMNVWAQEINKGIDGGQTDSR